MKAAVHPAPVRSLPSLMAGILTTAGIAFVVMLAVVSTAWHGMNSKPHETPAAAVAPVTVQELFDQTNVERVKAGVPPVTLDERLNVSAQIKADDMQQNDYYDHVSPLTGRHGYEYIDDQGLRCKVREENLNRGQLTAYDIISDPVFGFMGSEAHRKAMLNPDVDLVGFGINGSLIVQHFCGLP